VENKYFVQMVGPVAVVVAYGLFEPPGSSLILRLETSRQISSGLFVEGPLGMSLVVSDMR